MYHRGDEVIATKCAAAQGKLNQLQQPVEAGPVSGLFLGCLIGLLFMMPLVGAASSALAGRFTDVGINNSFMKEAGDTLQSRMLRCFR